ncbi:hypothetical protein IE53DRAFT_219203 [Violaceomyces palustris]|uniref:Uncharacterized protein n=1 Tax=Violaceomyces palustris TaxID=1673888 RepID=A0ACD0P4T5_9BASI|nr:hypothetical protein IE53DRAFT_219203 [Violaceomyces palustris]
MVLFIRSSWAMHVTQVPVNRLCSSPVSSSLTHPARNTRHHTNLFSISNLTSNSYLESSTRKEKKKSTSRTPPYLLLFFDFGLANSHRNTQQKHNQLTFAASRSRYDDQRGPLLPTPDSPEPTLTDTILSPPSIANDFPTLQPRCLISCPTFTPSSPYSVSFF